MAQAVTERKHAMRGDFVEKLYNIAVAMEYSSKRNIPFTPQEVIVQEYPKMRDRAKRIAEYFTRAGHLANGGGHGKNKDMQYYWIGPSVTPKLIREMESVKDQVEREHRERYEAELAKKKQAPPPPATPIAEAIQGSIVATHHPEPPKGVAPAATPPSDRYAFLVSQLQHVGQVQEATLTAQAKIMEKLDALQQSHYRLLDALSDIAAIHDKQAGVVAEVHKIVTELNNQLQ